MHHVFIRLLSCRIITLHRQTHNQNHTYKNTDCKDNVWVHSKAHLCHSSVSQEILTLLLRHWWLHPLITISCISRWSQARLTSLTRPLSLTRLIKMGWTLSMNVCVKVYRENYFCNCQGLDDFPHHSPRSLMLVCVCMCVWCVCVCLCVVLSWPDIWDVQPIQHIAQQVWHCMRGSVNWDREFVCLPWWGPFQEVREASHHHNTAPLSISAAICRSSLVASTSSWLSKSQLWFIHCFCHVKMIHGSTLSNPIQHPWSLAHSFHLCTFINHILNMYQFTFMVGLHIVYTSSNFR